MRLRKSDPTGAYWYLCDGVSPASPVLTDGHTSFTPGLSEYNSLGSRFYLADAQGNSRGLTDGGQTVTDGYNWDAFGNSVSRLGSNPTAYAWNEASGYQTDNDGGLTLLGHRYYDRRTGRFISQDPAGDGDNWYAYCGNDPMDGSDPEGLFDGAPPVDNEDSLNGGDQTDANAIGDQLQSNSSSSEATISETIQLFLTKSTSYNGGKTWNLDWIMPLASWMFMNEGMGGGMGGGFMTHRKGARPSTKGVHQNGMARGAQDKNKTEDGDITRARKEAERRGQHTGVSTRDPDGTLKRARQAEQDAQELELLQREKQEMDEWKALSVIEELDDME